MNDLLEYSKVVNEKSIVEIAAKNLQQNVSSLLNDFSEGTIKEIDVKEKLVEARVKILRATFEEDAVNFIKSIAPSMGYDLAEVVKRIDIGNTLIGVLRYDTCNGSSYGFDTIYLVWRNLDSATGKINYKELVNTVLTKDHLFVEEVRMDDDFIYVTVGSTGSYSGKPFIKTIKISKEELIEQEDPPILKLPEYLRDIQRMKEGQACFNNYLSNNNPFYLTIMGESNNEDNK